MASAQLTAQPLDVVDSIDRVAFDTDTDTFWATYDSARDDLSLTVVAVVASIEDCEPTDLTPLQTAVDTDALEALFDTPVDRLPTPTSTSFRYESYEVTVSSEEIIQVTPLTDA